VCESADFLATGRHLPLETHALLSIMSAGAYGHVMASNYNARPRPPELVVDGEKVHLARPRETLAALFAEEQLLPADAH
jgi:diaminopimelate decarboxylase